MRVVDKTQGNEGKTVRAQRRQGPTMEGEGSERSCKFYDPVSESKWSPGQDKLKRSSLKVFLKSSALYPVTVQHSILIAGPGLLNNSAS